VPEGPAAKLFVCFISSTDPATKQPWCPDVRAALPRLDAAFSSEDAPKLAYVHVGQKPECVASPLAMNCTNQYVLDGRNWTTCTGRFGVLMPFLH